MKAYAPASVTAVFAPPSPDSEATRSMGASIALVDGVKVSVTPAPETSVTVDGDPAPFDPVVGVCSRLDVTAAVDVRPAVPLGAGFGASGAATLATALAAADEFDLDVDRSELVWASHEAEVAAGTGLGDVFVQDRGGMIISVDGASSNLEASGERGLVRTEPEVTVGYESFGGIATAEVLDDDATMGLVREHGIAALSGLDPDGGPRDLFEAGWTFARETGLVTDAVTDTVARVQAVDGAATMAMVGESVVGVDADGVLANETDVDTDGARTLS
jgi:pantoate kinase